MSQVKAFVQKVLVNGEELNRQALLNATYIETMDMSAPALIAEINDDRGDIRDEMGLVEGAELLIEFGDVTGDGEALFTETFIVSLAPLTNGVIKVEAFTKTIHQLKEPCNRPRFFVDKPVVQMLAELCQGVSIDCSVKRNGTYHLNHGMTRSKLLRDIARDFGAAVWVNRGVIHFHTFESIMAGAVFAKVGLNDPEADIKIRSHDVIRDKPLYERIKKKTYHSWSTDKGMAASSTNLDAANVIVAWPPKSQLNNLSKYIQPLMSFEALGNSDLEPSKRFEFSMLKLSKDASLDESLPMHMVLNRISHFTENERYLNLIEVGVLNG